MTVKMLIHQLLDYPMDTQVVDTDGSPIMYSVYAPNKWTANREIVRLEPKSQIDINEWLYDYIQQAIDSGMSDQDFVDELKEQGFTLEDIRSYREDTYQFCKKYW